jgi:hypothetical protein
MEKKCNCKFSNFFFYYSLIRSRFSSKLLIYFTMLLKLQNKPRSLGKTKSQKEATNVRDSLFTKKTLSLLSFELNLMYKSPFIHIMMTD